ncbi:hypothetical protein ACOME3_005014 [Neoechinorhynchus agilis]
MINVSSASELDVAIFCPLAVVNFVTEDSQGCALYTDALGRLASKVHMKGHSVPFYVCSIRVCPRWVNELKIDKVPCVCLFKEAKLYEKYEQKDISDCVDRLLKHLTASTNTDDEARWIKFGEKVVKGDPPTLVYELEADCKSMKPKSKKSCQQTDFGSIKRQPDGFVQVIRKARNIPEKSPFPITLFIESRTIDSYEQIQSMFGNEESRLRKLVSRHRVMLVIKGTRESPRCGFSKRAIDLLNSTGVPYDTYDIINDPQAREGLKKMFCWPTYPQLYVEGNLVGGLDIMKEMNECHELKQILTGKEK